MAKCNDSELEEVKNNILYDLDTIRIENTSIGSPEESYKLLKLLNQIQDNFKERFEHSGNLTGFIQHRHLLSNNTCYEFDYDKRMEGF